MTVSVVLNGARSATRVSDATRARIKEVAERLSYQPNAVARGLTRRRMDTIGVVALVQGGDVNLYFLEVIGSTTIGRRITSGSFSSATAAWMG
jgi:LacI family transcriptional regulator